MRIPTHFLYIYCLLILGVVGFSAASATAGEKVVWVPEIIATVNGEPLTSSQAFVNRIRFDFGYYSKYDSSPNKSNLEKYRKNIRYAKKHFTKHLAGIIRQTLHQQWMEQQGITVTDEELETVWQSSEARKKFLNKFNEEWWEKEKPILKTKLVSYKEALDPKNFPNEIYKPSQIEAYTAHLKKVHQKYFGNHKESFYRSFSEWAMELKGWVGLNSEQWTKFEQIFSSPAGLEKYYLRNSMKSFKVDNRILKNLSNTDAELKQCLEEHPQKTLETRSEGRRKCIGGKINEFWKTIIQKADIQIHDPELEPALDLLLKTQPWKLY